jgi:hypothetical protein
MDEKSRTGVSNGGPTASFPGWRMYQVAFAVLLIILGGLVISIWALPAKSSTAVSTLPSLSAPPVGENPMEQLRDRINDSEKEIANQEKVLAVEKDEVGHLTDFAKTLMTVTGIFAFLIGAASWKTLEDQRKAANENLDLQKQNLALQFAQSIDESNNSLASVERLRDEVQRDFPMFGRMRSNFSQILQGLEVACIRLQPNDDTYSNLRWDEEQRILFYENAIATSLLLDTKEYAQQLSEINRLLGVFYGSRFTSTLVDGKITAERNDLNRARFYFDRAIDYDAKNYQAYVHAGHFTQYYDDKELARISINYFERAAVVGFEYQRPWITISIIELEAFQNSSRALASLSQASLRPKYDVGQSAPDLQSISYLEAYSHGYVAKKLPNSQQEASLQSVLDQLKPILQSPNDRVRSMFLSDREMYFSLFAKWPSLNDEFSALVEEVDQAEGKASRPE